VFDRVSGLPPWKNIYVDGTGKPYLLQSDPNFHMYVYKNKKKQVFGYFPYVKVDSE
jgi:hypothetical protein